MGTIRYHLDLVRLVLRERFAFVSPLSRSIQSGVSTVWRF
jgi:hypothetical protein